MRPCQHGRASTACPECAAIHLGITPSKDELRPRQWTEGEEAEWIADKIGMLGDYGQDAARVLRRQVSELAALREKCAQLEKDIQVAKGQYQGACDIIAELQRKLDGYEQAAKQEPVGEVMTKPFGSDNKDLCVLQWKGDYRPKQGDKLYRLPPNLPAIIEQAKAEKEEELAVWIATQRNDVPATGEEFAAAIRARKP